MDWKQFIVGILSPQVVIVAGVLAFCWKFKDAIENLMGRILKLRFPGGDAELQKQSPASEDLKKKIEAESAINPVASSMDTSAMDTSAESIDILKKQLQAAQTSALLWEMQYLNYFLVPKTKYILEFYGRPGTIPPTIELYDNHWKYIVPDVKERDNVLSALRAHSLVKMENNLIEITNKGRYFLHWLKPIEFPNPFIP